MVIFVIAKYFDVNNKLKFNFYGNIKENLFKVDGSVDGSIKVL